MFWAWSPTSRAARCSFEIAEVTEGYGRSCRTATRGWDGRGGQDCRRFHQHREHSLPSANSGRDIVLRSARWGIVFPGDSLKSSKKGHSAGLSRGGLQLRGCGRCLFERLPLRWLRDEPLEEACALTPAAPSWSRATAALRPCRPRKSWSISWRCPRGRAGCATTRGWSTCTDHDAPGAL